MIKRAAVLFLIFIILLNASGCGGDKKKAGAVAGQLQTRDTDAGRFRAGEIDGIPIDENTAVITDMVVDVFTLPDVRSERITQAIYNQPVTALEEKDGWTRVAVLDGSRGWVRSKFVDRDISSIYGGGADSRIVVTSKDKSIYSYPDGGVTVKDVVMGSEFYSFNSSGDAYEVYLPGNMTGWLKGSGIISLDLNEEIPLTKKKDFVSTAMKFKGTSYLISGMSSMGMDSSGLVYICARINGVDLPRSLEGQLSCGSEVRIEDSDEGDLVFTAPDGDRNAISGVGICIGNGSYIYAGKLAGYVTFGSLKGENADGSPAIVRRIFHG